VIREAGRTGAEEERTVCCDGGQLCAIPDQGESLPLARKSRGISLPKVGNSRHGPLSRVRKSVCQGGGNDLHRTLHISDHTTEVGTPEINAELE
jgi:hypothetical protein